MRSLLSGWLAMGGAVSAFFFQRFWKRTADRLFLLLAVAFALMAVNAVLLGLLSPDHEQRTFVYVSRLLAFALVAMAVVQKNRS